MKLKFDSPTWGSIRPRQWQVAAFNRITSHIVGCGEPGVCRAIMGSGKSIVIAELAATVVHETMEPIVIVTPSILLVHQLATTILRRMNNQKSIGLFYTNQKRTNVDIIVCCLASFRELADRLYNESRTPSLLIIDEAHRSECETLLAAINAMNTENIIGFTATPFRASASESLSAFRELLYDYGPAEAMADGVVVPWRIVSWTDDDTPIDDACLAMVANHKKIGPGIVDARDIEDAESFNRRLFAAGIPSATIHSANSRSQNNTTIDNLRDGKIVAVHVNMLAEGADYPWLRWMCLRRPVGSRVRFLQQIGRCLRSYPGKTEAVFLDPNDLFGAHKISHAAALGEIERDDAEEVLDPEKIQAKIMQQQYEQSAEALTEVEGALRRLIVAFDAAGFIPDRVVTRKLDRMNPATKLQIGMCRNFIASARAYIPDVWYTLLETLAMATLNFGGAADLACILASVSIKKQWPLLLKQSPESQPLIQCDNWKQVEFEWEL